MQGSTIFVLDLFLSNYGERALALWGSPHKSQQHMPKVDSTKSSSQQHAWDKYTYDTQQSGISCRSKIGTQAKNRGCSHFKYI